MENTRRHHLSRPLAAGLRAHRLRLGWSIRDAAAAVGISPGYLCLLEQGHRCPSIAVAHDLLDAYGLPPATASALLEAARPYSGRSWLPPAARPSGFG